MTSALCFKTRVDHRWSDSNHFTALLSTCDRTLQVHPRVRHLLNSGGQYLLSQNCFLFSKSTIQKKLMDCDTALAFCQITCILYEGRMYCPERIFSINCAGGGRQLWALSAVPPRCLLQISSRCLTITDRFKCRSSLKDTSPPSRWRLRLLTTTRNFLTEFLPLPDAGSGYYEVILCYDTVHNW